MIRRAFLGAAAGPSALAAAVLFAVLAAALLPLDTLNDWMREDGPIETATVVLYAVGLALAIVTPSAAMRPLDRACLAYVLAAFIAREISVRKHLLNGGLGDLCCTPSQTKWLVGVLAAVLVAALVRLALGWLRAVRDCCGRAAAHAVKITLATSFAAAVLSQLLDSAPKLFERGGGVIPPGVSGVLLALEETLEMIFAALLVIAIVQSSRYATRSSEAAQARI